MVHWFDLLYHMMVLCLHVCEATRYMCKTNIHIFSYFHENFDSDVQNTHLNVIEYR